MKTIQKYPAEFARGGAIGLPEEWVLFTGVGRKVGDYANRKLAKSAMDKLWETGEYDEVGIQVKSEWDKIFKKAN